MKPYLAVVLASMTILSCKTASFDSPNQLMYMSGTLYLANGQSLEGRLSVNDGWGVKIYLPGEKRPQHYSYSEVEAYKIRNDYFERKEIRDGASLSRSFRYKFMRRLTPDKSKIGLYEYLENETHYTG